MNKRKLYETIMRKVSIEVKKALNENSSNDILKHNLVDKIIAMAQDDSYDISELEMANGSNYNGEDQDIYYIQIIDEEGLHCCPEWDVDNLECYNVSPFTDLLDFDLEDIQEIYDYMRNL